MENKKIKCGNCRKEEIDKDLICQNCGFVFEFANELVCASEENELLYINGIDIVKKVKDIFDIRIEADYFRITSKFNYPAGEIAIKINYNKIKSFEEIEYNWFILKTDSLNIVFSFELKTITISVV